MSVEEKLSYLRKTEYDYDGDAEAVKDEIMASIDYAETTEELSEWKDAVLERLGYVRDLARIYDDAFASADSKWFES